MTDEERAAILAEARRNIERLSGLNVERNPAPAPRPQAAQPEPDDLFDRWARQDAELQRSVVAATRERHRVEWRACDQETMDWHNWVDRRIDVALRRQRGELCSLLEEALGAVGELGDAVNDKIARLETLLAKRHDDNGPVLDLPALPRRSERELN